MSVVVGLLAAVGAAVGCEGRLVEVAVGTEVGAGVKNYVQEAAYAAVSGPAPVEVVSRRFGVPVVGGCSLAKEPLFVHLMQF